MEWFRTKTSRSVTQLLQKGYRNAVDALYPHRCPICEGIVDRVGESCPDCGRKLKYIVQPFCMKCGKQLDFDEDEICVDCGKGQHAYIRGVGAFSYTEAVKASIYRFKYANKREYAAFYADSIVKLRGSIIKSWHPDVIIPVPLHAGRKRKRGFNQAELVARELGKYLNIPVDVHCLARVRNTAPQKALNDKERAKNIKRAFQVRETVVEYKKIVLVDDIYTTGTTIDACTKVLIDAGAGSVYFVSICIGRGF